MELIPVEPPTRPARFPVWELVVVAALALLFLWALSRLLGLHVGYVIGAAVLIAAAVVWSAFSVARRGGE